MKKRNLFAEIAEGFGALARAARWPSVAIGGIKGEHCAALFAAGAHGVAVVSAICGQPDPAQATAALSTAIVELKG